MSTKKSTRGLVRAFPISLVALLVLVGCGADVASDDAASEPEQAPEDGGQESDPGDEDDAEIVVAYVSFMRDVTDLYGQSAIALEDTLTDEGINFEMLYATSEGGEDHEGMDGILHDMITIAPDYIVAGPASYDLTVDRLAELEAAGIKVIFFGYAPAEDEETPLQGLLWMDTDHYSMGSVSGVYLGQEYCDEGRDDIEVALFRGTSGSEIGDARIDGFYDGFTEALAPCGASFEVVEEVYAEFDIEQSFNYAQRVATARPNLDIVVGANSNTALGALEGLQAQGRADDIDVVGMGGQLNELAALCRDEIRVMGYRHPRTAGVWAGEAIIADLLGEPSDEAVRLLDTVLLTSCDDVFEEVPHEFLEDPGFRDNLPEELWQD